MAFFQSGSFTLHSGASSSWKIECDALTATDWDTLASLIYQRHPLFHRVEGVPRGGIPLEQRLSHYATPGDYPLLIVDDVLTTGASMEAQRQGRPSCIGAVVFARRSVWPSWIHPVFVYMAP